MVLDDTEFPFDLAIGLWVLDTGQDVLYIVPQAIKVELGYTASDTVELRSMIREDLLGSTELTHTLFYQVQGIGHIGCFHKLVADDESRMIINYKEKPEVFIDTRIIHLPKAVGMLPLIGFPPRPFSPFCHQASSCQYLVDGPGGNTKIEGDLFTTLFELFPHHDYLVYYLV